MKTSNSPPNKLLLLLTLLTVCPIVKAAPCSENYYIDIELPNGTRWDMCWEPRRREGVIFHNIHYQPPQGQRRMILYQAALAQVHVPYDDNGIRFHDVTDYGFGGYYQQELSAAECSNGKRLIHENKPILCQQTLKQGEAYRFKADSETRYGLNLFSASKISDYTYIPYWLFADDGSIEIGIDATGALQRIGSSEAEKHGWLLETGKVGLAHLHNFFWRLDFDLNGTDSNDVFEELNFVADNGSLLQKSQRFTKETARSVNPETARTWRVIDTATTNGANKPIGYEIQLNQTQHRDIGPRNEPFTHHDIYVTKTINCERFASHNLRASGCRDDLSEFINDQPIMGEDITVWPSLSFYHMPRAEDMPNMDAHRSSLKLAPLNWHDQNPSVK